MIKKYILKFLDNTKIKRKIKRLEKKNKEQKEFIDILLKEKNKYKDKCITQKRMIEELKIKGVKNER